MQHCMPALLAHHNCLRCCDSPFLIRLACIIVLNCLMKPLPRCILASYHATKTSVQSVGPIGRTDGNLDLDRTNRSQRSRWTGPIGPGNTPGPSRTDKIGSTRLGPKSIGLGRSRSGPDRGCPYLATLHDSPQWGQDAED